MGRVIRRGGPRYGPPHPPSLGRAPAQPWRASGLTQDVSSPPVAVWAVVAVDGVGGRHHVGPRRDDDGGGRDDHGRGSHGDWRADGHRDAARRERGDAEDEHRSGELDEGHWGSSTASDAVPGVVILTGGRPRPRGPATRRARAWPSGPRS